MRVFLLHQSSVKSNKPNLHMAEEIHDFQTVESGVSDFFPAQCSSLRKNGFVVMKNRACKIVEMSTSKTGKHGHAKVHMIGIDIFTGKKYEDICPSTHNMNVPYVGRCDYQLVNIEDGFLSLMYDDGMMKDDIKIPDSDMGKDIKFKFDNDEALIITILKTMGTEAVIAFKPMNK